jgi:hypothetical protein
MVTAQRTEIAGRKMGRVIPLASGHARHELFSILIGAEDDSLLPTEPIKPSPSR